MASVSHRMSCIERLRLTAVAVSLFTFSFSGSASATEHPLHCASEQTFLAEYPVALEVYYAHMILPLFVQSRSCIAEKQVNREQFLFGMMLAVKGGGCAPETPAFSSIEAAISEQLTSDAMELMAQVDVPENYLRDPETFCDSEILEKLLNMTLEPLG